MINNINKEREKDSHIINTLLGTRHASSLEKPYYNLDPEENKNKIKFTSNVIKKNSAYKLENTKVKIENPKIIDAYSRDQKEFKSEKQKIDEILKNIKYKNVNYDPNMNKRENNFEKTRFYKSLMKRVSEVPSIFGENIIEKLKLYDLKLKLFWFFLVNLF